MDVGIYAWLGFGAFVVLMMVLDLGVFHRNAHKISMREAAIWSIVWVALALVFNAAIYVWRGPAAGIEFLTGYLIEKSLSVDNVFVFAVIFSYFSVPAQLQHRVLFYGILGALVMRLVFIVAGVMLLDRFHWMFYVMGGFLVFTGIKLFRDHNKKLDVEANPVLRLARRWLPVTGDYVGQKFFVRQPVAATQPGTVEAPSGTGLPAMRWFVTPLFLVLLVVEATDLVFAVDSIPAILAVTRDPFIVFTSNVFAILGLRALYFLLAEAMQLFRYLVVGLAGILCFVGTKMLLADLYPIPTVVSLAVVGAILAISVAASLLVRWCETGTPCAERCEAELVHATASSAAPVALHGANSTPSPYPLPHGERV